jgi:hypothetical protein
MANNYLLGKLDPDTRRIVEDIYDKINRIRVDNGQKSSAESGEKADNSKEKPQIVNNLNQFDSVTGSDQVDLASLDSTLDQLRININALSIAVRKLL